MLSSSVWNFYRRFADISPGGLKSLSEVRWLYSQANIDITECRFILQNVTVHVARIRNHSLSNITLLVLVNYNWVELYQNQKLTTENWSVWICMWITCLRHAANLDQENFYLSYHTNHRAPYESRELRRKNGTGQYTVLSFVSVCQDSVFTRRKQRKSCTG